MDDLYTLPSGLSLTTAQSEAYTPVFSDLNTMAQERIGRFITGDLSIDAEWDTFQQDLIDMGIEDCIAIYQECYNDFIASRS